MLKSLTPDRWERLKTIFHQVIELDPRERSSYLDSTCAGDSGLREEVEFLIAHHENASGFLEPPVSDAAVQIERVFDQCPATFDVGRVINDRFQILRLIGQGGMGEIYEAADRIGDVRVALKTIRSGMSADDHLRSQFRREVQIARQITHPNVCRIYDIFECDPDDPFTPRERPLVFLTMELLEGESLSQYLAAHSFMRVEDAFPVVRDIVAALAAAHDKGVIHRDLKSSNVMLVPTEAGGRRAVLTDFGLADMRDPLPVHGLGIAGTPDYMAPEQIDHGRVGFTADIFSLGVVMYEMLTGKRPFGGSSTLTGAGRRTRAAPPPPRSLEPSIDPRWDRAIMKCLETDPARRYSHGRELLADLDAGRRRTLLARRTGLALGLCLLAAVGGWLSRLRVTPLRPAVTAVAVLPFRVLSGDPDTNYFADGLTDEVIQMLARVPGLRVTARNSAEQVKGAVDLKAAGKLLGVQAVLTGGVRKRDGRVSVTAQLTNVADGQWMWSGSYDEETRLLPRVRVNLSLAITGALRTSLPDADPSGADRLGTGNVEAYRLYLLGRHHAGYRTDDGLRSSIDYLEQAVANDSNFAPAYAQLAEDYNILAGRRGYPPEEYLPKAETAALRAIALDPGSSVAHISLGLSYQRYRWDWPAADREFKEAIRLSQGLALAHHRYSGFLSNLGQHAAALREIDIAEKLDPLSAPIRTARGVFLYRARRYDEAILELQETLQRFPSYVVALPQLADVYCAKGMWSEALSAYRRADTLGGYENFRAAGEAAASARLGRLEEARAAVRELEAGFGTRHYSAEAVAHGYRGLGDADKAFYWFGVAADRREPTLVDLKVDPANDTLRGDHRFSELLTRLRL